MKEPSTDGRKLITSPPAPQTSSKGPLVGGRTTAKREKKILERERDALADNPTTVEERARAL